MNIEIINETYTETTREADPNERWDVDDTQTSNSIQGIKILDKQEYGSLDTEFDVEKNKNYYLVYGIYSTGDSFSHHEGKIEYVQLYLTKDRAEKCAKILQEHAECWGDYRFSFTTVREKEIRQEREKQQKKNKNAKYSVDIETEEGKTLTFSVPWTGYFESLSHIEVETVRVI